MLIAIFVLATYDNDGRRRESFFLLLLLELSTCSCRDTFKARLLWLPLSAVPLVSVCVCCNTHMKYSVGFVSAVQQNDDNDVDDAAAKKKKRKTGVEEEEEKGKCR